MSPTRPSDFRRSLSNGFKPYTRVVSPILTQTVSPIMPQEANGLSSPELNGPSQGLRPTEHLGFPTYAQYKQVETSYLQSLTPRRQGKALISQAMFDRIWDVLQKPDAQGETAQFRFWARKMFTISKNHPITLGQTDASDDGPREVLLHDNLLVAIQEQLYDLLCYCHGSTGHGGRDKTCALIRKHYTWVPKDLVSNFIKACPTCIMKKCGNFDSSLSVVHTPSPVEVKHEDSLQDFFRDGADSPDGSVVSSSYARSPVMPWTGPSHHDMPSGSTGPEDDPLEAAYREAILRARAAKLKAGLVNPYKSLQGHPMAREVSLYKGLPNGWQYRHPDYPTAYAEFMKQKEQQANESESEDPTYFQRPRIPSIAPMWGPNDFPADFDSLGNGDLSDELLDGHLIKQPDGSTVDAPMHYLMMHSDIKHEEHEHAYEHQIDPMLLNLSAELSSVGPPCEADHVDVHHVDADADAQLLPSIRRSGAPPRLDLDSLSTEKSFRALMAYRDSLGDIDATPDSPVVTWHPDTPSPTSSVSSYNSQLSAFPTVRDGSSDISPASSTIPTPTDENGTKGLPHSTPADAMHLGLPQPGEIELSASIQAICGL